MLLIRNGRLIDPAAHSDRNADLFIRDGRLTPLSELPEGLRGVDILDAGGLVIAPGLVDMHVHFRDPGYIYKEDLLSGAAAAAAGGVTTAACMPNTLPVLDSPDAVSDVVRRSREAVIRILPYGAVTAGQKGERLTDAAALKSAGVCGLSDDGNPVTSARLMREALRAASELGLVISSHCEDAGLVSNYAVNEGAVSRALGLPGRPAIAEELMVARDVMLAGETGARVHIAHVSTAGSVAIVREAKAKGIRVTAETCPQYFALTENDVLNLGSMARVNPPLRTKADVAAIIRGLEDGTLDAVSTDHAPHAAHEKALPLTEAPSGMVGLETSLGLALTHLYHTGRLSLFRLMALMSTNPSGILGLPTGGLNDGSAADLVLFDPEDRWTVDPGRFVSKGKNTPFAGIELRGRVRYTIVGGKIVYTG